MNVGLHKEEYERTNFGHKRPAVAGPLDGLVSRAPIRAQPLPIYL